MVCSISAEPSPGHFKARNNKFDIENADFNLCTHLTYAYMDETKSMFYFAFLFDFLSVKIRNFPYFDYFEVKKSFLNLKTLQNCLYEKYLQHFEVIFFFHFHKKEPWDSLNSLKKANYKKLSDLRKKYPHLKVNKLNYETKNTSKICSDLDDFTKI